MTFTRVLDKNNEFQQPFKNFKCENFVGLILSIVPVTDISNVRVVYAYNQNEGHIIR